MRVRIGLLFLLLAASVGAQPYRFGGTAALTNTRYGVIGGDAILATNGTDVFFLSTRDGALTVSKLVEGEHRAARVVARGSWYDLSAVWTGTHFLVAGNHQDEGKIVGQLLDRNGDAIGSPFTIQTSARGPRLAWNGQVALMLYAPHVNYQNLAPRAIRMSADGTRLSAASESVAPLTGEYAVTSNGAGFAAVVASSTALRFVTFTASGEVHSSTSRETLPEARREAAIASNGSEYLAAWTTREGVVTTCTVMPGAAITEPVVIDDTGRDETGAVTLTWDGTRYLLAYRTGPESELRVVSGEGTPEYVAEARRNTDTSSIAVGGRSLLVWMARDHSMRLRDSSNPDEQIVPAGYGAPGQELLAIANSSTATLFVWSEWLEGSRSLHAGVRTRTGDWTERMIVANAQDTYSAMAASDGEEFMVIVPHWNAPFALRLASNGRLLGPPIRFAAYDHPSSIVWTGTRYVVGGVRYGSNPSSFWSESHIFVMPMERTGALGARTLLPRSMFAGSTFEPRLATDGASLMVAWVEHEPLCLWPWCLGEPLAAVTMRRLSTATLQPLDSAPLLVAEPEEYLWSSALFWTGSEYIIGWTSEDALHVKRYGADGRTIGSEVVVQQETAQIVATTRSGEVLISWLEWREEVMILSTLRDTAATAPTIVARLPYGRITPLSDNRLAWTGSVAQFDPPHHGARRIMLAFGGPAIPPPVPAAPALSATAAGREVTLEWTVPQGTVNGYRIEYRIGDGAWNELDRWLAATKQTTEVRLPAGTARAAFRMRAWNDGGTSAYSNVVMTGATKRRSVR